MTTTKRATTTVAEAREIHRLAHHDYTQHVVRRSCCTGGRLCDVGQELCERADDAGKAWERAEKRERGAVGRVA